MSDEFEDLLKRWLRQRGTADRSTIEALAGHVAALPSRRRRGPSTLAAAAAVVVAIGLAAIALAPRFGTIASPTDSSAPDARGFADDPRLAACRAYVADVDRVFEMVHARYFPLYFPGWWQGAPELEVADPALVVIGREQRWPVLGAAPQPGQTVDPDAGLGYQMCIAVGPPNHSVAHDYGVTRFARIVTTLSAADLARAEHMDPDVLADPATWPFPERLAPCYGLTNQVQYVFEAHSASDFARYFPAMSQAIEQLVDVPAIVVVYRGRGPDGMYDPGRPSLGPNEHDVCVILETDPPRQDALNFQAVDITGFHVRLDEPAESEPAPTPDIAQPSFTPLPAPAWAGDARAALECDGPPSEFGVGGPIGGLVDGGDTDLVLSRYLTEVHNFSLIFPTADFKPVERTDPWVLYGYQPDGRTKAAVAIGPSGRGAFLVASVASCDPSEFNPVTPLGGLITIWRDPAGDVVPTTTLREEGDCYNGTQLELDGRLFVWDPNLEQYGAYDPTTLEATFDADATLPSTATDTGYRDGDRRLYLAADGKAAYIASGDTVQRWPHVRGDEVSRIDCN